MVHVHMPSRRRACDGARLRVERKALRKRRHTEKKAVLLVGFRGHEGNDAFSHLKDDVLLAVDSKHVMIPSAAVLCLFPVFHFFLSPSVIRVSFLSFTRLAGIAYPLRGYCN